jgi:hypothetical protein
VDISLPLKYFSVLSLTICLADPAFCAQLNH